MALRAQAALVLRVRAALVLPVQAALVLLVEEEVPAVLEVAGALLLVEVLAAEAPVADPQVELAMVLLVAAGRLAEAATVPLAPRAAAVWLAARLLVTTSRPRWPTCGRSSCRVSGVRQMRRRSWQLWSRSFAVQIGPARLPRTSVSGLRSSGPPTMARTRSTTLTSSFVI